MKITVFQPRAVESLGRNNLSATGAVASAKSQKATSQSRLTSMIAKVGAEFIERKENSEFNASNTNAMLRFSEVAQRLGQKRFFSAKEASSLPAGAVKLKNADGTVRNDIPAYEVYPYLLDEAQSKIIEQESSSITNPLLREDFTQKANEIAAQNNLRETLKAADEQRTYLKAVSIDTANKLAVSGKRISALKQIEENPDFSKLDRTEINRNINESWEWEEDSRVLNTQNIQQIALRLEWLTSEKYGKGAQDFLGAGKGAGKYNVEADIRRFKGMLQTLSAKVSNKLKLNTEELIRAAKDGNLENNALTAGEGGYRDYIESLPLTQNVKNTLIAKAEPAVAEGRAFVKTLNTTFSEDESMLNEQVRILIETDAEFRDEADATLNGISKSNDRKRKELYKDANSFLTKYSPAVQAAKEQLRKQAGTSLGQNAFENVLSTLRVEQQRIGLTSDRINFLSEAEVNDFKDRAAKAGPMNATALISQLEAMRERYKSEWPAVYTQLIREDALKPEHVVADNIEDRSLQIEYIDALKQAPELQKSRTYKDNITAVERIIATEFLSLKATTFTNGAAPNNAEGLSAVLQWQALENGVTAIVMSRINAAGKVDVGSITGSIKGLVEKITTDKWEIYGNIRIPKKSIDKENQYDYSEALKCIKLLRNNLQLSPDLIFYTTDVAGISPADQQKALRDEFLKFNEPQTNENESGVSFKWASGQPVYVIRNGIAEPLSMSFSELDQFGRRTQGFTSGSTRLFNKDKWMLK